MSAAFGFYGKIPDRGDFVRAGLPPAFVTPLDAWWQQALSESRAGMGEAWVDAWMEAPVWRFAWPTGLCGPLAAVGLWLPSTDRAGRLFPLTLAAVGERWSDVAGCGTFLHLAEEIGREALERDLGPDALSAAIVAADKVGGETLAEPGPGMGLWWTDGSPLVAPARRPLRGLPDGAAFAGMLRDGGGA